MTHLESWLEFGAIGTHYDNKRTVRRWLREFRERRPVIDRWNYPNDPHIQRGAGEIR